jgi:hypothetical protein
MIIADFDQGARMLTDTSGGIVRTLDDVPSGAWMPGSVL